MHRGREVGAAGVSAVHVCGWKRLGGAKNGQKVTPCWNQEMNDAIAAKKVVNRHRFKTKPDLLNTRGTLGRESLQPLLWKSPQMQSLENLGYKPDCIYWQANTVFWQTIRRLRGKKSNMARFIKGYNNVLLSSEENILGIWREYFKDLLNPVTIILPSDTQEVHLEEENTITAQPLFALSTKLVTQLKVWRWCTLLRKTKSAIK